MARPSRRLELKPDHRALAEIRGRNRLSWAKKIRYGLAYADTRTFIVDLRILAATGRVEVPGGDIEFVKHERISGVD